MMQPVLSTFTMLIAAAAIVVPATAVTTFKPSPNIEWLQRLADRACRCERDTPHKKDACWRGFVKRAPAFYSASGEAACYPLSQHTYAVGEGIDDSVTLRYRIVGGGRDAPPLCSKEEAIAGEAIWHRVASQAKTEEEQLASSIRADAALLQFARDMANGRPLAKVVAEIGCVTGYLGQP